MNQMIQTQWRVITGAPCSGKTAIILDLEDLGYRVVHETARRILEEERRKKGCSSMGRNDRKSLQPAILKMKLDIESALPVDELVFMDRGAPDSIAYYLLHGLDPADIMDRSRRRRYQTVFFCDRLPLRADSIRNEDEATVSRLNALLLGAYRSLGYRVVRVPAMSIQERTDFILKRL